jgi:hypothetical protein
MRTFTRLLAAAVAVASVSCGDVIRTSDSPSLFYVSSLAAGTPPTATLLSDVERLVTAPAPCTATAPCSTIFNDVGSATLGVSMKDTAVIPTTNNQVTINRYHVDFSRADGRNTPGVDVPFGFDGAVTVTIVPNQPQSVSFELVRHIAKEQSPLAQLRTSSNSITTIATITFYGADAVGNAVSASGQMSVNFGNFADQ